METCWSFFGDQAVGDMDLIGFPESCINVKNAAAVPPQKAKSP
jgi:hypothetical protein